jgi:hypothetical protein
MGVILMIHEYAIDPELAAEWGKDIQQYRYFIENFGLGTQRIMSEFPRLNNWRRQFGKIARATDKTNELPRITAIFEILTRPLIQRTKSEYDGDYSWLENAELEDSRSIQKFKAIIAKTNPRNHSNVLTDEILDSSPLWNLKREDDCQRESSAMAQLFRPLLSNCSEVHFIDPHFGPENSRHRRPLEAFLETITLCRHSRPPIKSITIHTSIKSDFAFFKNVCLKNLPSIIPKGLTIILKRWKQRENSEKIHGRFILTDIGGIFIEPGLDEGKKGELVKAFLLGRDFYKKEWLNYVEKPAFDTSENEHFLEIIGKKLVNHSNENFTLP